MSADALRAECECGCGAPTPLARWSDASRGHVKGRPIRFIKGHNAKFWNQRPVVDRFWDKVAKADDCWLWTASLTRQGYGRFSPTRTTRTPAHRFSYELVHGPLSPEFVVDHLCKVRSCVNPDHLEAVTPRENARRASRAVQTNRCKRDHPFDETNTRYRSDGSRHCRACSRLRQEGYRNV